MYYLHNVWYRTGVHTYAFICRFLFYFILKRKYTNIQVLHYTFESYVR
jgi:hypothetical protein